MLNYLVKARALRRDPGKWIVDQGWLQLILSCHAGGEIVPEKIEFWLSRLGLKIYAPERILLVQEDMETVIGRVSRSPKHLKQCRNRTPAEYVTSHFKSTAYLASAMQACGIHYEVVGKGDSISVELEGE
jgi:hypothetical protein